MRFGGRERRERGGGGRRGREEASEERGRQVEEGRGGDRSGEAARSSFPAKQLFPPSASTLEASRWSKACSARGGGRRRHPEAWARVLIFASRPARRPSSSASLVFFVALLFRRHCRTCSAPPSGLLALAEILLIALFCSERLKKGAEGMNSRREGARHHAPISIEAFDCRRTARTERSARASETDELSSTSTMKKKSKDFFPFFAQRSVDLFPFRVPDPFFAPFPSSSARRRLSMVLLSSEIVFFFTHQSFHFFLSLSFSLSVDFDRKGKKKQKAATPVLAGLRAGVLRQHGARR